MFEENYWVSLLKLREISVYDWAPFAFVHLGDTHTRYRPVRRRNVQKWVYPLEVFETSKVGVIGIFVLLKYENELELVTSDISINSVSPLPI